MKTTLFGLAFVLTGFALTASGDTTATPPTPMSAQLTSFVKVVSASYTFDKTPQYVYTIHVSAVTEFSNSCMAPQADKEIVAGLKVGSDKTWDAFTLLQVTDQTRICDAQYKPVDLTVTVGDVIFQGGDFAPNVLPDIYVNGVKASAASANQH